MSTRDDLFAKAKQTRQENQSETQRSGGGFDYGDREPIYSTAITTKPNKAGFKQVRLLGNPIEARNDDPFSPRIIHTSMILGDDGKKFRCTWPSKNEDPGWILWKVYTKVMSFTYNKVKQERDYHYQDKFPELFNRVSKNNDLNNNIESGWRPRASILMNVIDREAMDWHRDIGSTALLSRKASPMEDGTVYYEPGFPQTVYNNVWDTIVGWAGNWENYDVIIEAVGKDPWYRVYHPVENQRQFEGFDNMPDTLPIEETAERPLTEEELGWSRINLDEVFRVTSAVKIENRLGVFIQDVDKKLGTNFYPELKAEADKQQKEFEAAQQESERKAVATGDNPVATAETNTANAADKPTESAESEKSARPRKRARKPASEDTVFDLDAYTDQYPGVAKMTPEEREVITGFDAENQKFMFKEGSYDELYYCPAAEDGECNMDSPDWFHACPGCGIEFEEG
jgi:hypothetical protein